ncbi:hypothetical protein GE061_008133 [Apolygus lucorum]|uniref:Uncharacterized protein n=1 Tax=Apolygus lucorum TaxID=248454 RepID=A0A8S9WSK6_APOLU|nr:hypothetical protein GE061_008133 [Apolygus lucorum]
MSKEDQELFNISRNRDENLGVGGLPRACSTSVLKIRNPSQFWAKCFQLSPRNIHATYQPMRYFTSYNFNHLVDQWSVHNTFSSHSTQIQFY